MADGDVQAESTDNRTDNTGGRPAGTPRVRIVAGRPGLLERFPDIFFPAPAVVALLAIMVFPSFFNLYISLNEWFAASASPPEFVLFDNYIRLFTEDEAFPAAIGRTLYFTVLAVGAQMLLGLGIALVLHREFRGQNLARSVFMLPMMATPAAIALVWVLIYHPTLGVINYLLSVLGISPQEWLSKSHLAIPSLALVDTWQYTPFVTMVLLAGLAAMPLEPFESARIDGAGSWQMFRYITLPLLRPTIVVIDSLKVFDTIYVMTQGGPGRASETLNLYAFRTAFEYFHVGYAASISLTLIALVFVVSAAIFRAGRVQP
jgi:multiple sugar transport system permease protein